MASVFGDRLVPMRSTSDFQMRNYAQAQTSGVRPDEPLTLETPNRFQEFLKRELNIKGGAQQIDKPSALGFSFRTPLGLLKSTLVPASMSKSADRVTYRTVISKPDKILDAPNLFDDYYVHPIDWSAKNFLVASLGDDIFVWYPETSSARMIGNVEYTYVRVVACDGDGELLAAGMQNGKILVYDVANARLIHRLAESRNSVYDVVWNGQILTTGTRSGNLAHYDLRKPSPWVSSVKAHDGNFTCTVKWSPDFRYLASSGRDKTVKIWSAAGAGTALHRPEPLTVFKEHKAAPQSLAWCPWQSGLIASGGAAPDNTIRLWSINTGTVRRERPTKAAVTALQWSEEYRELISAHGDGDSRLYIWTLPDLDVLAKLEGDQDRVLDMVLTHDQTMAVTAGAEEAIKFWNCFPMTPERKEKKLKREWKLKRYPFNMIVR